MNDRVITDHWYDWCVWGDGSEAYLLTHRVAVLYAFMVGLTIGLVTTSALVCREQATNHRSESNLTKQEIGVSTLFVCISEDVE